MEHHHIIKTYQGEIPVELINCFVMLFSFIDLEVFEHHVDGLLKIALLTVTIIYTIFKTYNEYKNGATLKNRNEPQD
jgi:hypothetical protein